MSRLAQFSLVVSVSLSLLVAGLTYLATSAWFLWGLLPEGNSQLFVETSGKAGSVLATAASRYELLQYLPFNPAQARRFAYAVSDGHHRLAITPGLGRGGEISATLERNGWKVQRIGFLLFAENGGSSLPQSWAFWGQAGLRGFKQAVKAVVWERLPARPAILARTADAHLIPGLPTPSRLLGRRQQNLLQVVWQNGNDWRRSERLSQPLTDSDTIFILVPGQALTLLPKGLAGNWNTWLAENLKLSHTQPNLLADLTTLDRLVMESSGDTITVGAQGNPENFLSMAETWFSQEKAASQPVTRAFRLPDGTLGYEKQPAPPPKIFGPPGADGCRVSQERAVAAFRLCQAGNLAFLTTSPELALLTKLSHLPAEHSWQIELGPALTTRLRAFGNQSKITLELELP